MVYSLSIPRNYWLPTPEGIKKKYPLSYGRDYLFEPSTDITYYKTSTGEHWQYLAHWYPEEQQFKWELIRKATEQETKSLLTYEQYLRRNTGKPYSSQRPSRTNSPIQTETKDPDTTIHPQQTSRISTPIPSHPETQPQTSQRELPHPIQTQGLSTSVPINSADPTETEESDNSTPDSAMSNKGPPIAPPTSFEGNDRHKTKQFIHECDLVIDGRPGEFPNEAAKVAFVLSYMKGSIARAWAMEFKTKQQNDGTLHYTQDYDTLKNAILDEFKEVEQKARSTATLECLRQGTGSVDAYTAAFSTLQADTAFNEAALIRAYVKGLNPKIANTLLEGENPPTTLDQWKNRAARYEVSRQTIPGDGFKKWIYPGAIINKDTRNQPREPFRFPTRETYYSKDVPMEVDVNKIDKPRNKLGKLTDKERDRLRKEGRCFRCREKGHIGRNCNKAFRNRVQEVMDALEDATPEQKASILLKTTQSIKDGEDSDFQ